MCKQALLVSSVAIGILGFTSTALAQSVTDTITITNPSGVAQANYPLQFGRPFVDGEIPHYPQVLVNGTAIPTQANVENTYEDGSVKFAVISVIIPSIPTSGSVTLSFQDQPSGNTTALTTSQMLSSAYNFDAIIAIASTTGQHYSASARAMLQNGNCTDWASGSISTTILCADDSVSRIYDMGFDSYKSLRPRFYATFWPATGQVQVRYIGENSNTTTLENMEYNLTLTLGSTSPQTVFTQSNVQQSFLTRWTQIFWIGGAPQQEINIDNNLAYLETTDYFANYDTSVSIPEPTMASFYTDYLDSNHTNINDPGLLTTYMPTTGGRGDIGSIPDWAADWLYSGDWRMRTITLGLANLAGAWPLQAREGNPSKDIDKAQTISGLGLPISGYGYPGAWFPDNNGSYSQIALQSLPYSTQLGWVPDGAHQPGMFYTEYVLTGDYYYLEEAQLWAGMMTLADNRSYSGGYEAILDQIRGEAWVFRNLANTALITPDSETTLKAFYTQLVNDTLAFWEGRADITGDQYQSTPEWQWAHNNDSVGSDPLNFIACSFDTTPYCAGAMWQQYYFGIVLGMEAERGFSTSAYLDWVDNMLLGQFSASNYNIYNLGAYDIAEQDSDNNWYPDWGTLETANFSLTNPDGGSGPNMSTTTSFTGQDYYPVLATAATSFVTSISEGSTAWNFFLTNVRDSSLFSTYFNGTGEIDWDILPRTSVPVSPTAFIFASPSSITLGATSTISWSSTNSTSCSGSGFNTFGATSGSAQVSPTSTTNYSVTCTGSGGEASDSTTVDVTGAGTDYISSISLTNSDSGAFSLSNLSCDQSFPDASSCTVDVTFTPSADTSYSGTLAAYDTDNNEYDATLSGAGTSGSGGGGGGGGTIIIAPPSTPTGLAANTVTSSSVALSWNASTDTAGALSGYDVYRNGAKVGIVSSPSYLDTQLTSSTTYSYAVDAYDTELDHSSQSPALLVTTMPMLTAASPPTAPPAPTPACTSTSGALTVALSYGSSGSQVTLLQQLLSTLYPSALVSGYFGSLTEFLVEKFQASHGIVSSGSPSSTGYGNVGARTRAALNALSSTCGVSSETNVTAITADSLVDNLSYGSTGAQVTLLQKTLAKLYPGTSVTGYYGSATETRVEEFQRTHGLVSSGSPQTTGYGTVGPLTRFALNALAKSYGITEAVPPASSAHATGVLAFLKSAKSAIESFGRGLALALNGGGRNATAASILFSTGTTINFGNVTVGTSSTQTLTITVSQ